MNIAILLSGGVDSSVALSLLKDSYKHLSKASFKAFYLKIWLEDELSFLGSCPWEEDLYYVHQVCRQLDVPLEIISLQEEYRKLVVSEAISELKLGRTPSPDILCNQRIKFGAFVDAIPSYFDKIVSGHYAQIEEKKGGIWLKQSPDKIKDQTYFLSALNQEQLKKITFPIGHLDKKKVRDYAQKFDLPNRHRKDSQGICFLGKIKYNDFVKHHLGEKPGDIIDIHTNKKLGNHRGFWFHTTGQRKGLNLSGGPWYVAKKDVKSNIVYVSHGEINKGAKIKRLLIDPVNWITQTAVEKSMTLKVKLRHGPHKISAQVFLLENTVASVELEQNDSGAAPGQWIIFYRGEYCLGGGVIRKAFSD